MTDTELDRDLEDLRREALHAVAGATPTLDRRVARRSSLRVVPVAGAAIVVAGVTGVAAVVVRDQPSVPEAPATQPVGTNPTSTEPVVLAPRPDLPGVQVVRATTDGSLLARPRSNQPESTRPVLTVHEVPVDDADIAAP